MAEHKEITWKELNGTQEYFLLDIRDKAAFQYGNVKKSVNIPMEELEERINEIPKDQKIAVYCKRGMVSKEAVELLCENGRDAYELEGGYSKYLLEMMQAEEESSTDRKADIERSIQKKFHKELFSKFAKAINTYDLLQEGDKVAVCISGGKDSMLMAKLFQEIKRHNKFQFELVFLVMDPGYSPMNRQVIENNAKIMGIPLTIFESNIFEAVYEIEKSPCYLCARMRRGYLYSKAKELGCNKIALGHHYDDVIETILMGMLYGGQVQTMMPKLHSSNFEGMELIRPMYLIKESAIKAWRDTNGLHFIQCACRFTENCVSCGGGRGSKRDEMKELVAQFRNTSSVIETNIFNSVRDINLRTVMGYHKDGEYYNFLDDYDQRGNKGKKEDLPEDSLMQENPAEERKESDQAE